MPQGSPFGGGGGAYTYSSRGAGPGGPSVFDLGDLFSQFFSNAQQQQGGRQRTARRVDPFADDDVQLESRVKASDGSWLDVKGVDVYSDVRIAFDRAILGTVATVITIDGKAEVKVPPGTSSGKKLRLRGKGVSDRSGRVGDHYITVQIDVPRDLDEDAKKQLFQFVSRLRKRGHND
jgi:molecular chaperone DnaJ